MPLAAEPDLPKVQICARILIDMPSQRVLIRIVKQKLLRRKAARSQTGTTSVTTDQKPPSEELKQHRAKQEPAALISGTGATPRRNYRAGR